MHFLLFLVLAAAVSFVSSLVKPLPLRKCLRDGCAMFFATVLGMGALALGIHLVSL